MDVFCGDIILSATEGLGYFLALLLEAWQCPSLCNHSSSQVAPVT